ncbi:DUF3558 domain-containing protein [Kutzneria albida]|uniref:Putative secreted protein n=1 Tax=Kutzneria albida DSM 43870 TaxID=1449976 RepID=W5W2R5_9PSEU|nr:DUF3558 domain-containing protein [Kutzneria albida]AHH95483.1 putative secreted protein [Kutzneria albida DSM 43870]
MMLFRMKGKSVRRGVFAVGLIVVAFVTVGCTGSPVQGDPGPVKTPVTSEATTSASTGSNTSGPTLATLNPCDLLSSADISAIGGSEAGKKSTLAGAPTCDWGVGAAGVNVLVLVDKGTADLSTSGKITETQFGSHQARELRGSAGECRIAIAVTSKSRVDVTGVDDSGSQDKACALGEKAAKLVEPKLPKS